ncbi:hypothetical protein P154DRAFT_623584 [Amniculicola lignicola CBS 123094]|uniref:Uncharacterized protein n=1 Tax=Amniculicola lignicola CBS 123094 TaxID=1392246 RepID=A0A6A5WE89_9PLEO|nr:hypothetical protein P154DRAFT_623584 [Amniculicola lignicola CBS 123094]
MRQAAIASATPGGVSLGHRGPGVATTSTRDPLYGTTADADGRGAQSYWNPPVAAFCDLGGGGAGSVNESANAQRQIRCWMMLWPLEPCAAGESIEEREALARLHGNSKKWDVKSAICSTPNYFFSPLICSGDRQRYLDGPLRHEQNTVPRRTGPRCAAQGAHDDPQETLKQRVWAEGQKVPWGQHRRFEEQMASRPVASPGGSYTCRQPSNGGSLWRDSE